MKAWAVIALVGLGLGGSVAARAPGNADPSLAEQRARLATARRAAARAAESAASLSRAADAERDAAARARADEKAQAAKVAAAAADVATAEARVAVVDRLLADERARLGDAQAPVARLLAALQSLARRPTVVALAQPGSVDDLVHVRAVLGSAVPAVRARTAAARAALATTRRLQADAALAAQGLRDDRAKLEASRVALVALEADHRRLARGFDRDALGESDRALALGEQARDLVDRMAETGAATATAPDLATLAGPLPRPVAAGSVPPRSIVAYRLPVGGRLVTGLGELSDAGVRSRGLTFAVAPGATVLAPAGGTVRYAQRFRGYGTIVILDHGDGWSSLVTGLAAAGVRPGEAVAAGSPIGQAAAGEEPRITVELRRRGRPMDIAALIRS